MAFRDGNILIFDGACGTNLQRMEIPASAWEGRDGCNEFLNVSAPEVIREWHSSFLSAGATVLETNTFGANGIVLAEYGLADRVAEINRAAVGNAREAIRRHGGPAYVAGSIGPTTKLPSLGHVAFDPMAAAFSEQARALVEAGADLLILETCQDLLQIKIALVSCFGTLERMKRDIPVMVSITIENTGTMLVGTDIAAALAAIEPFPVFSIGLNCATGPEGMVSHLRYLCRHYRGRVSCIPNAGIPQVRDGKTYYPLSPEAFAAQLSAFVRDDGVSIVGGCCGTTPEYIRKLRQALDGGAPGTRNVVEKPSLSSLYQAAEIRQEIPPFLIGERCNANGSRRFRDLLLADDYPGALRVALEQEGDGAHAVDLCTAYAGRDEKADLSAMSRLFAQSVQIPMVIDSTTPDCIEAALKIHPGRCLVNSVNLEDGGKNLERVCRLAKTYGAAVIALTIHEKGMALTVEEKVATAREIHDLAVHRYGLRPSDLLFDVLTFTIGSGDATLVDAAANTLAAIRRVKEELPGVLTLLGVSNISFGLSPASRRVLNSVFLHEAIAAGLDTAIIDAAKVLPMSKIPDADREVCLDLIHDRRGSGTESPLSAFLRHFSDAKPAKEESAGDRDLPAIPPEEELAEKVVAGDKEGLEDLLTILLSRRPAASIINQLLVPAMRKVGELFGRGEMLLPFVLQSAEVMKRSVDTLAPFMEKAEREEGRRILLATVAGDVHDIGKNLVDIILSNNGYRVFNLGIKVPAETIIEKARELGVDAIGLSGLLVKSALVMRENLPQFAAAGLRVPVLLGGAAGASPTGAQGEGEPPRGRSARLGIVTDGRAPRTEPIARMFRAEIRTLLEGDFALEEAEFEADWTPGGVRDALDRALADPSVDIVLAAGVLASDDVCRRSGLAKPVVAPLVLDARIQGCPIAGQGSGEKNLAYVTYPPTFVSDLRVFRSIVPFERLAVVHASTAADATDVVPQRLEEAGREAGVSIVGVPAGRDEFAFLTRTKRYKLPTPPQMNNHGNFIISLGNLVAYLGTQAEAVGCDLSGLPLAVLLWVSLTSLLVFYYDL